MDVFGQYSHSATWFENIVYILGIFVIFLVTYLPAIYTVFFGESLSFQVIMLAAVPTAVGVSILFGVTSSSMAYATYVPCSRLPVQYANTWKHWSYDF